MRILHTSDWHLGRRLYDKERYEVFENFLNWLLKTVNEEQIDTLIVAGDIFDTTVPTNRSSRLYFDFLSLLGDSCCRHVVIVGGNHDSPTQLQAPQNILSRLGIHVVGGVSDNPTEEIIELKNENGELEAVVCAVPYLRERDILRIKDGSLRTRDEEIVLATKNHYDAIVNKAVEQMGSKRVPLIATGHLFTVGAKSGADENELYIGSLGAIPDHVFPSVISYLALGHMHGAQTVGGDITRNYSGAPIAFNFDECHQQKIVRIVDFDEQSRPTVSDLCVPVFDRMLRIQGSQTDIMERLRLLAQENEPALVEIIHEGPNPSVALVDEISEAIKGTPISVLRIRDKIRRNAFLSEDLGDEFLEQLDPTTVFFHRLENEKDDEEMKEKLLNAYKQTYRDIQESIELAS